MTGNPVDRAAIVLVAGVSGKGVTPLEGNTVSGRPAAVLEDVTVLLVRLAVVTGKPDAVPKVELLVGWPIVDRYVVVTVTTDDELELLPVKKEDTDDR